MLDLLLSESDAAPSGFLWLERFLEIGNALAEAGDLGGELSPAPFLWCLECLPERLPVRKLLTGTIRLHSLGHPFCLGGRSAKPPLPRSSRSGVVVWPLGKASNLPEGFSHMPPT